MRLSMKKDTYLLLENYMLSCMDDSAHDKDHVYRVLYTALDIAQTLQHVDYDILICACLLHDIGRKEQFEDPKVCHAQAGADKALLFLIQNGFSKEYAESVSACIRSHRYRSGNPPQSIEAQILFDADKIDVSGVLGIARTLIYQGQMSEPLYSLLPDGQVSDGTGDTSPSFLQEYKYKLEKIYDHFFTERAKEIAMERRASAVSFYQSILQEIRSTHQYGKELLDHIIDSERL